MARRKHKLIHPGETLLRDFMEPMGVNAAQIARGIDISAQHVGRIIHGERGVTADVALRLARYLGTTPEFWMNLQAQYDIGVVKSRAGKEIERRVRPHSAA